MKFILRLATPVGKRLAFANTPLPGSTYPVLEAWPASGWELEQVQSLEDLHAELSAKSASQEAA